MHDRRISDDEARRQRHLGLGAATVQAQFGHLLARDQHRVLDQVGRLRDGRMRAQVGGGRAQDHRGPPERGAHQPFALRVFTNRFQQREIRFLHACDPSSATAWNLADAAFSGLKFSFDFGIPVTHMTNLAGVRVRSRSSDKCSVAP